MVGQAVRRALRFLVLGLLLGALPIGLAAAGQADKIVFVYGDANARGVPLFLITVAADGSGRTPIVEGASFAYPAWSPDRSQIAFVGDSDCLLAVSADGSGSHRLARGSCSDSAPTWSPDGRRIAFTRGTSRSSLYVVEADGSSLRRLSDKLGFGEGDLSEAWSPDGKRILFVRLRTAGSSVTGELYTVAPDGSGVRLLYRPPRGQFVSQADWAADGRIALVLARKDGREVLATTGADGKGIRELVRFPAKQNEQVRGLAFSPDGSKIVYCYFVYHGGEVSESVREISVVSVSGGPPEHLFDGCYPDW